MRSLFPHGAPGPGWGGGTPGPIARFSNAAPAQACDDTLLCAIAVDAEEDFDWASPVRSTDHSTTCMRNIPRLQAVTGEHRAVPTYLLTYPVLEDPQVVNLLRDYLAAGDCAFGAQLHPWVTPPFETDPLERSGNAMSYAGNLAADLEERKLVALINRLVECFGETPGSYRSGRYGLSFDTAALLEKHGFAIDTSIAPRTTSIGDGGPNYSAVDYQPFWFGERARLLELPLCRSIIGWGGAAAAPLYQWAAGPHGRRRWLPAMLTRLGIAERITLSPEGNDLQAMIRLVSWLKRRGQRVFVISFHSSSLAVGRNPYVRSQADLEEFYRRLAGILDYMASCTPMRFVSLAQLPGLLK